MSRVDRIKAQLEKVRELSEGFLKDFQTTEQWLHQVHPSANHALWFAGHMATADNFFVSLVDPSRAKDHDEWSAKFGMGSVPTPNAADYPSPEEVVEAMRERRVTLLSVLTGLTDADLDEPMPEGTPDMWPDKGSVFETVIWHETLHAGQVSIARKSLGHDPLLASPKKAEATA